MNCQTASELLSAFYDGELGPDESARVRDHAQHCKRCSAELRSYAQLGSLILSSDAAKPASDGWDRIAAKLESTSRLPLPDASQKPYRRFVIGAALALAASVLLALGIWNSIHTKSGHHHSGSSVSINFQEIMADFSNQPTAALDSFSRKFDGYDVPIDHAESLLGYKPYGIQAQAEGFQLVSTTVLKLPYCDCSNSNCTCNISKCNCAASVCKRNDGSTFLIVEHCKFQNVSFGALAPEVAKHDSGEFELFNSEGQLAMSWISDNRRLTAIGLKGSSEAAQLLASDGR